ncbi:hypothetical protein [Pseudomonas sp. TH03]|nr:hypothetical protein [Pseudomonas sp. TH03]
MADERHFLQAGEAFYSKRKSGTVTDDDQENFGRDHDDAAVR